MKKLLFLGLLFTSIVKCGGWFSSEDLSNFFENTAKAIGNGVKYTSLTTFLFSAPTATYLGSEAYKALKQKRYPKSVGLLIFTLLGGSIASVSGLLAAVSFQK